MSVSAAVTLRPLFGLVLSGGKSTRMGHDKGGLHYYGIPQVAYLYTLLTQWCTEVCVSVRKEQQTESPYRDFPLVIDSADIGPMGGLAAAFSAHDGVAWLLIAVDIPELSERDIGALIDARRPTAEAVAFLNPEIAAPEPMYAIYEPTIVPLMRQEIAHQRYSLKNLLHRASTHLLDSHDTQRFNNVNTPQDYAAVLETMQLK